MDQFDLALTAFLAKLQAAQDAYGAKHFPKTRKNVYTIDPQGRKFVRIVCVDGNSRSVYCFVERSTGFILKAASWDKPAKGARGSIYNANPLDGCGPHGVAYLNHAIHGFNQDLITPDRNHVVPAKVEPQDESAQIAWLKSLGLDA